MGTASDTDHGGVDWRQLLLVSLCLVGLIVAAFLAPPPVTESGVDSSGRSDGSPGSEPLTQTPADTREQRRDGGGSSNVTGDTEPIPIPGETAPPTEDGCGVLIESTPKAGHPLTVLVYQDLEPAGATRVWFNDRYVGRTDQIGQVTGQVPYQRELNVTVESPGPEPCQFYRRPDEEAGAETADRLAKGDMWPSGAGDSTATRQQTAADNDTGQYRVAGSVNVTLLGEPYPGTTVPLVATVDGVPVRNATVSHDGDIVGRTDTTGQSQLTVPDTDTTAVTVSRGEFEGTARVDVLNLHVRVMPAKTLPVPGDSAAVNATKNGEAVTNATVTLGDQRRGTTGADGTVAVSLPANPSLTVTAATDRQTARTTLWDAYIGTVVVSSVLLVTTVVTIAIAALLYTPRVARGIGILWALFDSLFFIGVLWERDGLVIALTVVGVAALYHYRADALSGGQAVAHAVKNGSEAVAGYVARVVQWTRRTALWLVGRIEATLNMGRRLAARLAAWLASLPLTVTGRSRRFQQWLRSAGYRAITVARAETTPRRIVTLGFSCVVVILSYVRWGTTGAAVAVAGVGLGAVSVYTSGRTDDTDRPTAASSSGPSESVTDSSDGDESALPSLRDIWRAFARHVVPGHWRTRTPGEVSRAAIDSGLPRAPVEALTEAFRDVEYGGQSSDSRREQARNAYDALVSASDEQEDTE
ncbi:DUF4129 domain-containing protein [Haloarcula marismortui]|uniref:Protein-glutamine gamma-glutamyltransferase-like C-terminal domain-containing protein n=1 Tax=Haloarcula marismortui ATCC 33799 TaxID=662475 RepID=M0JRY4_9EURY|nr:DUF4129 domain-containing protein [Haloarcula californiae]EMA11902.1 hypothetical protein C435_18554 [Haloarcula californiae ATCC 33799]